jgi:hypothetical protein
VQENLLKFARVWARRDTNLNEMSSLLGGVSKVPPCVRRESWWRGGWDKDRCERPSTSSNYHGFGGPRPVDSPEDRLHPTRGFMGTHTQQEVLCSGVLGFTSLECNS